LQTANLTALDGFNATVLGVGLEAQKTVYVGAFRMVYLVTVAFGGK
jgi:hypothetical protein